MKRLSFAASAFILTIAAPLAAQDRTTDLLRDLSNAAGPPGFEEPVRKIMVERMKPLADELRYDGLGSVIARQGSSGPRIMLDAHMDELGGVVRRATGDGFLTMQMLGGWLDQALAGSAGSSSAAKARCARSPRSAISTLQAPTSAAC
jgi:endoglucanase